MAAQASTPSVFGGDLTGVELLPAAALHAQLLAGRRRAIGWGMPARLPFVLMQSPYRFVAIVDDALSDSAPRLFEDIPVVGENYLDRVPADSVVVVLLAPGAYRGDCERAAIVSRIAGHGPFPVLDSFLPARDEPRLATDVAMAVQLAESWQERLNRMLADVRHRPTPVADPNRVALWIHRLCKGGAERQMVLLALGLRRLGKEVDLITLHDDVPAAASWARQLADAGVKRIALVKPDRAPQKIWPLLTPGSPGRAVAERLAPFFMMSLLPIFDTYGVLVQRRPQSLIAYLDDGNVIGGVAAVMAGVPEIHMSGRNAEPNQFPDLALFGIEKPRLRRLYQGLLRLPSVTMGNNSAAGAASYAAWLALPAETISVVPNAVESRVGRGGHDIRRQLGIEAASPILLGIMRFCEEKQPLTFVRVAAAVLCRLPAARAILLGEGPLKTEIDAEVDRLGLQGKLLLPGLQDDVDSFYRSADLLLLTSRMEGMPNVVLEAQAAGKPVVATDVGGVRDALAPALDACLVAYQDVDGMIERCADLLTDKDRARALGKAARDYLRDRRSPTALATHTLAACRGTAQIAPTTPMSGQ